VTSLVRTRQLGQESLNSRCCATHVVWYTCPQGSTDHVLSSALLASSRQIVQCRLAILRAGAQCHGRRTRSGSGSAATAADQLAAAIHGPLNQGAQAGVEVPGVSIEASLASLREESARWHASQQAWWHSLCRTSTS